MRSAKKNNRLILFLNRFAVVAVLPVFFAATDPPVSLLNTSLHQPSLPVAYTSVDNIMTIRGDLKGGSLRIERSGGPVSMRPGTSIMFKLRYTSTGKDTFRIFSDDRLLLEKIYEIRTAGSYTVGLTGTEDSLLTAESVKKAGRLSVKMPGTLFRPTEKVVGFSVDLCTPERKILRKFTMTGSSFSAEFLQALSESPPGTMLVFHTISTNLSAGKNRHIKEFNVVLK